MHATRPAMFMYCGQKSNVNPTVLHLSHCTISVSFFTELHETVTVLKYILYCLKFITLSYNKTLWEIT